MVRLLGSLWRRFRRGWAKFWMQYSGPGFLGRNATRLAALFVRPFRARYGLAKLCQQGYFAPTAVIAHGRATFGRHVFIGERVIIYGRRSGGPVQVGEDVHINHGCLLETAKGGGISIGDGSRIQPDCIFSAYMGDIVVGRHVQIAKNCAFFPYNHQVCAGKLIKAQGCKSCGPIVLKDDVWLGYGVVVLDGVTIGTGAVVGAGAVVTSSIPDNAIAVGNPARVIRYRT